MRRNTLIGTARSRGERGCAISASVTLASAWRTASLMRCQFVRIEQSDS
jgi:hypothetical protein